jgi:hypothetical protein
VRKLVLLCIVLAVAAAVAQEPQNEGVGELEGSECYKCHQSGGPGGGRSALVEMFIVEVDEVFVTPGEPFDFNVTVTNTWYALEFDIQAELDLSRVAALSFAADIPPKFDAGAAAIPGATFTDRGAKSAETTFEVPFGATDFVFEIKQDQSGDEAATLQAELWEPGASTDGPATKQLQLPGKFVIRGSETIANSDGLYTVRISRAALLDDRNELDAVQQPQSVSTAWSSWFNITDQTSQFVQSPIELDGDVKGNVNKTSFGWKLYAEKLPNDGQSVDIAVELTAHYNHAASQSQFDTWRFGKSLRFPFTFPELTDGDKPAGGFTIGNNETQKQPEIIATNENVPLARVGEILGYAGAMLVLSSLATGSILGRPMKWFMQLFFRKARKRIVYHNFTSQALLLVALAHLGLFLYEAQYHWTIGIFFGGISILMMLILGLTGIFQIPMIRGTNYWTWRIIHYGSAFILIFSVAAHILMDGIHFDFVQDEVANYYEWNDPIRDIFGPSPVES